METQTINQGITFLQAWQYGGWLMWALLALSVVALALVLYILVAHRASALVPYELQSDIVNAIIKGNREEATRLSVSRPSAFSDLALAGLEAPAGKTAEAVELAGAHIAGRLNAVVEYLLDIATIAPLVGLLGTVLGMFTAFCGVANDVASAKPVVLAAGVSQAIVTTVFGLAIAIPILGAYAFLRRRAARRTDELELAATRLVAALEGAVKA